MFYSVDAEKSITGTILYDPDFYNNLVGTLHGEDFYDPLVRKVFQAQQALYDKGLDINVLTVINELQARKITDVPEDYISELMTYRVDEEAALAFANQVSEFAGLRTAQAELGIINSVLASNDEALPLSEVISKLDLLTEKLGNKAYTSNEMFGDTLVLDFFSQMDNNSAGQPFLGIPEIDDLILDFNPGELIVFAARPGGGKTAAMLQVARTLMDQGKRVGFITREMRPNKLMQRLVSARSGVSGTLLAKMSGEEAQANPKVREAAEYYGDSNKLIIDPADPGDIETVSKAIRKMVRVHKCDVVFIDYLQLLEASGKRKDANRQQEVADISRKLKILSNALSIPIVTASQLNRESAKSVSQRPTLAHLRESGAIEQDASIVVFLYPVFSDALTEEQREEALSNSEMLTVMIEIAKQRNGPVDRYQVMFKTSVGIFANKYMINDTTYSDSPLPYHD